VFFFDRLFKGNEDITAPIITDVTASQTGLTSAAITWTANEAATSQIEYGPNINYGVSYIFNNELVKTHNISLTGLTVNSHYHYQLISKDEAGNEAISDDYNFTTVPYELVNYYTNPGLSVNKVVEKLQTMAQIIVPISLLSILAIILLTRGGKKEGRRTGVNSSSFKLCSSPRRRPPDEAF